jgi:hypothetical protein
MKRLMFCGLWIMVFTFAAVGTWAQDHAGDSAARKAREETEVVFDLGRMFQFLQTMESEQPALSLSATQARDLLVIMTEIRRAARIDGRMAERWIKTIEDRILTVAQLTYVDRLSIARVSTSARGTGAGTGSGNSNAGAASETGSGSMSSFIAGGAFNPIVDMTRTMGQDFQTYFESLMARR